MRVGFFTDAKTYAEYNRREADAIRKHGLRQAKEEYEKALYDAETKTAWLRMNNLTSDRYSDEDRAVAWEDYLKWRRNYIKYLERKIRKLERDADKALAMA